MAILDKRTRDDPRRAVTERAFLEATRALLDEGASFADLSVARIAERAARTRTAFYTHFEDRRALLLALLRDAGGQAITALGPFLAGDGPITFEELQAANRGLLNEFAGEASLIRAVTEAAGYDEQIARLWDEIVGRIIEAARHRLEAHGRSEQDARALATALVWMTERTCFQQVVQQSTRLTDDEALHALDQVWWNAIAPPAGRP
jgi:TetR/AcrR family transcriptional regulator, ethionamide resistance regulator